MEKLGLGYKTIKKINPKIIYCSGTGFGQTGPYRSRAGHDINYTSIAGILSMTGMHTGRPVIPGVPFADMAGGGLFPAIVIIAGLLGRQKTGRGVYIDVSMTDVVTTLNIGNLASEIEKNSGESPRRYDILGNSVCYNTYKTKDDKYISLGNVEKKFWINFCKAIEKEDLIGKHYASFEEGEEVTELLKRIFASKSQAEWIELMDGVDSCFAPVLTPEQVLEDQHLKNRGILGKTQNPQQGETVQLGFPALFSGGLSYKRSPAPRLGEHTIEILNSMGYSLKEIQSFKENGVI
jgi:crotonobetainyl-CoA:carnitine CoA-transferase CaiB-like acyl-CoA transferase